MKCNSCKFLNPDDNKFCINCGSPLGATSGDADIDFGDVLGGGGGVGDDLLKDLEGLSLSTPDIGVHGGEGSDDIDLLLSDFEGTISQIILPEGASPAPAAAPKAGSVTRMILPDQAPTEEDFAQAAYPDQAPAKASAKASAKAPAKAGGKAAPKLDQSFDFFDTDLSDLVSASSGTGAAEASAGISGEGAVTRMILPGEEDSAPDLDVSFDGIEGFDLPPELNVQGASALFEEAAPPPQPGGPQDPFAGFELPDAGASGGPDSGLFSDPVIETSQPGDGEPADVPLFESGIFSTGDGLFAPRPVPEAAAPPANDASFADMGGEELDSLLAEIGGMGGSGISKAPATKSPSLPPSPAPKAPASPPKAPVSVPKAAAPKAPSPPPTPDMSLDALDAVLQATPEAEPAESLDDFLAGLEKSTPFAVKVVGKPAPRGEAPAPAFEETFESPGADAFEEAQRVASQPMESAPLARSFEPAAAPSWPEESTAPEDVYDSLLSRVDTAPAAPPAPAAAPAAAAPFSSPPSSPAPASPSAPPAPPGARRPIRPRPVSIRLRAIPPPAPILLRGTLPRAIPRRPTGPTRPSRASILLPGILPRATPRRRTGPIRPPTATFPPRRRLRSLPGSRPGTWA